MEELVNFEDEDDIKEGLAAKAQKHWKEVNIFLLSFIRAISRLAVSPRDTDTCVTLQLQSGRETEVISSFLYAARSRGTCLIMRFAQLCERVLTGRYTQTKPSRSFPRDNTSVLALN
jgi:hypothetical protein